MIDICSAGPCEVVKFSGGPDGIAEAHRVWAEEESGLRKRAADERAERRRRELSAIELEERFETWRNTCHIGSARKGLLRRVLEVLRAA